MMTQEEVAAVADVLRREIRWRHSFDTAAPGPRVNRCGSQYGTLITMCKSCRPMYHALAMVSGWEETLHGRRN